MAIDEAADLFLAEQQAAKDILVNFDGWNGSDAVFPGPGNINGYFNRLDFKIREVGFYFI